MLDIPKRMIMQTQPDFDERWEDNLSATPQPAPQPGANVVLDDAINALVVRAAMGKAKYGTLLMTENGRDCLEDWYQEQCDAFMYATQVIMEYRARKGQI
jgi:hypothetical protein